MKIVIIGGTGLIGSKTAPILRQGGHEVVAASPNTGVNSITGEGLQEAMAGTQVVLDLAPQPGRELTALEIAVADVGGDGEAGRDGNAERGHLGEPGAFAAEHVLHGRGAIGAALAEEVDERLGERPAHAGVATSGEAWRSWASSFGIGVG